MSRLVFAILITTFFGQLAAEITPIGSMEEAMPYFRGEGDWAVFDVNLVLMQPSEEAFQAGSIHRHRALAQQYIEQMTPRQADLFFALMSVPGQVEPVDPEMPCRLRELRQMGVKGMGFTSGLTGSGAGVSSFERLKICCLHELGIDFSSWAPHPSPIALARLSSDQDACSHFKEGILFAAGPNVSKGEVLVAFLQATGRRPDRIVMIDDQRRNLESVARALKGAGLPTDFTGLEFTAARDFPLTPITDEEFSSAWERLFERVVNGCRTQACR